MEKQFKRRFSFEVDKKLAKANDFRYKTQKQTVISKKVIPLVAILLLTIFSFSSSNSQMDKIGFVPIILFIWLAAELPRDLKKLRNNEYILKHGFLIPGVIIQTNKKEIDILTIVRFIQNSQEEWALFSITTKLHQADDTLKVGGRIPLAYLITGEAKGCLYENIYFAPLLYGTNSNEVINAAISDIDEFEWNFLERNADRYITKSDLSPLFLTGEDIHRYSLDKI